MAEHAGEKTHQPSQRKLQKAREKGQVPRSQELGSVASLLGLLGSITFLAPFLMNQFREILLQGLSAQTAVFNSQSAFIEYVSEILSRCMWMSVPIMGVLLIAGVFGTILLGGFTFSAEGLRFKTDSLNPVKNAQNLMNMRSVITLIFSVVKIVVISLIIWFYLQGRMEELVALRWASPEEILAEIGRLILGMSVRVGAVLLAIALADIVYQQYKYTQDMRMTHQEVKQENKDTEGSPEVRSRIRNIRMQMAREQLRQAVPQADVILVNPTHYAVALKYDPETMAAPILLAKGVDTKAATIREIGRAYGIPIMRRPELTRTIYGTVEVGKAVPEGLYMAVAEVLAVIYRLRQQKARR